jgi:hypothetical protein
MLMPPPFLNLSFSSSDREHYFLFVVIPKRINFETFSDDLILTLGARGGVVG